MHEFAIISGVGMFNWTLFLKSTVCYIYTPGYDREERSNQIRWEIHGFDDSKSFFKALRAMQLHKNHVLPTVVTGLEEDIECF